MEAFRLLGIIRSFTYLWLTVELYFTAYLYWRVYKNETSVIIHSLINLLFKAGFMFFFLTAVAISYANNRNSEVYHFLVNFIPVPALFLILAVRNFRERSLDEGKRLIKKKYRK